MTKKILLAEDDPDIRYILNTVLKNAGYQVETLLGGESIVNDRMEWPDLFLVDKNLPALDSLALCKDLKIRDETKEIPIIMMSSYHKLRERAKAAGVDDFIEKPFGLQILLQRVEKHLGCNEK